MGIYARGQDGHNPGCYAAYFDVHTPGIVVILVGVWSISLSLTALVAIMLILCDLWS